MMRGERIAQGRTAEVLSWSDDKVVKLFFSGTSRESIDREIAHSRAVSERHVPTAHYYETVQLDGRTGIIYQRLDGPSLLSEITRKPWRIRALARSMAALHTQIHAASGAGLPRLGPLLKRTIAECVLSSDLKARVLDVLASLEDGDALCHLDFHPDQIVLTSGGPIVIDWMTAAQGNQMADVARTVIVTQFGYPPNTNWIMLRLIDLMRGQLRSAYLGQYLALRPEIDRKLLLKWTIPMAAARLADGLPEEEATLKEYIRGTLSKVETMGLSKRTSLG